VKIETPFLVAGGAGVLALAAGLGFWFMSGGGGSNTEQIGQEIASGACKPIETVNVTSEDFTFGEADAPITLVEYASQTCSHCADFAREVVPKLQENYVKTGKVRFVFREFQRNRIDLAASVLGRCLGRDAFIPFTEMLFANQNTWMLREDQNIVEGLREMSRRAGMSNEDFEACMKKEDEAKRLSDLRDKSMKDYCIDATPTLLMNGRKLQADASTYDGLEKVLNAELKKLGKEAPAAAATATPTAPAEGTSPTPASGDTAPAATPESPPASSAPATEAPPAQ